MKQKPARVLRTPRTDRALDDVAAAREANQPESAHYDALIESHTKLELDYNRVVEALRLFLARGSRQYRFSAADAEAILRDLGEK